MGTKPCGGLFLQGKSAAACSAVRWKKDRGCRSPTSRRKPNGESFQEHFLITEKLTKQVNIRRWEQIFIGISANNP